MGVEDLKAAQKQHEEAEHVDPVRHAHDEAVAIEQGSALRSLRSGPFDRPPRVAVTLYGATSHVVSRIRRPNRINLR